MSEAPSNGNSDAPHATPLRGPTRQAGNDRMAPGSSDSSPSDEPARYDLAPALQAATAELNDAVQRLERVAELLPLAGAPAAAHERPGNGALTARQREILALVANGHSTQDIAAQLWLSTATVRNHINRALRALDARSRVQAVARARQRGLLP